MLYFYYGENAYLLEDKLRVFIARYLAKYPDGLGLHKIDVTESELAALRDVLETQSLFTTMRLVYVTGLTALSPEEQEELVRLFQKSDISTQKDIVVVCYEKGWRMEKEKKNSLGAYFTKNATVQEFSPYSGSQLRRWIESYVARREGQSDPDAISVLVHRRGEDMLALSRELDKLLSYANGEKITSSMVSTLVPARAEADVFHTIDALGKKDAAGALLLLKKHQEAGDDPFQIFSMFAYELRTLLTIKEAQELGHEERLTTTHKLHPFVVRKNSALARAFSLSTLVHLHSTLAMADHMVKTGLKEPYEALEDVIFAVTAQEVA